MNLMSEDNIVEFPGKAVVPDEAPNKHEEVKAVIEEFLKHENMSEVLILGVDVEGEAFTFTNIGDRKDILFLIEKLKQFILQD